MDISISAGEANELLPYIVGVAVLLFGWLISLVVTASNKSDLRLAYSEQQLLVQDVNYLDKPRLVPVEELLRGQLARRAVLDRIAKSVDLVVTVSSGLSLVLTFLFATSRVSFSHKVIVTLLLLLVAAASVVLARMSTYAYAKLSRVGFSIVDLVMLLLFIAAAVATLLSP